MKTDRKLIFKRVTVFLTAVMMVGLGLCGCGSDSRETEAGGSFNGYPIQSDETLTYWSGLNTAISTVYENAGETEFAKALKEKTGVNIKYLHCVAGQEETDLSLMIASGEMPDMVEYNWKKYGGGAAKSIKEEIILPLNDLMESDAPNLTKYLSENQEINKMVKTDEGDYYAFPFIRGDQRLLISVGGMLRRDWLEDLGLEIPKTVAELENVLTAFKEKKGAEVPLSFVAGQMDIFLGNFNTSLSIYLKDGKVVYGPMTEEFRFALETLNKWYRNGLLDPNFVSVDNSAVNANVLTGRTGYTVNTGGGGLGTYLDNMKNTGERFDMIGVPFTASSADGKNEFYKVESSYPGYGSVAITTSCKTPSLAARFLDYGYSEEGRNLYNYGIENVSYKMENGRHIYTDLINDNPDGLTTAQAMANYFRASLSGPFVQEKDYIDQFYYRPQQQEALNAWLLGYDNAKKNSYPDICLSEEENSEILDISTELARYVAKSYVQFINGTASFDSYDSFLNDLNKMNVSKYLEVYQKAYDRYMN